MDYIFNQDIDPKEEEGVDGTDTEEELKDGDDEEDEEEDDLGGGETAGDM